MKMTCYCRRLTLMLVAVFVLGPLFPAESLARSVGDPCTTLGETLFADNKMTTMGCFGKTPGQTNCGTVASPTCIYKQMSIWPVNESECGDGTLVKWDSATKSLKCAPIYSSMSCTIVHEYRAGENGFAKCPAGTNLVSFNCWRQEGGGENWQRGLFVGSGFGKTDSPTLQSEQACRFEGAAGVYAYAICCK